MELWDSIASLDRWFSTWALGIKTAREEQRFTKQSGKQHITDANGLNQAFLYCSGTNTVEDLADQIEVTGFADHISKELRSSTPHPTLGHAMYPRDLHIPAFSKSGQLSGTHVNCIQAYTRSRHAARAGQPHRQICSARVCDPSVGLLRKALQALRRSQNIHIRSIMHMVDELLTSGTKPAESLGANSWRHCVLGARRLLRRMQPLHFSKCLAWMP
jgi:hypothetical protein